MNLFIEINNTGLEGTSLGKPSIFSKEYEKRMKKRKRNITIICLIIFVLIVVVGIKISYNPINYASIKENIQAWIDSDTNLESVDNDTKNTNQQVQDEEPIKEDPEKPKEESMDINLVSGKIAKAVYIDENGEKKFTNLKDINDGVSFDISSSGSQMIITDTDSTITLYNIDGTSKVISKDQYVSSSGSVFTKEATMKSQPEYLWNSNPKFISEEKVIFVTNRPYFGTSAVNKYLWITDIASETDTVLWDLKSPNIEMGEKEEKGIKVTVNGNIYYIDENGRYAQ